ncbi:hypothetical protein RCL1_002548 [Eukaryota sp. TZLM3-RCL]
MNDELSGSIPLTCFEDLQLFTFDICRRAKSLLSEHNQLQSQFLETSASIPQNQTKPTRKKSLNLSKNLGSTKPITRSYLDRFLQTATNKASTYNSATIERLNEDQDFARRGSASEPSLGVKKKKFLALPKTNIALETLNEQDLDQLIKFDQSEIMRLSNCLSPQLSTSLRQSQRQLRSMSHSLPRALVSHR